MNLVPIFVALVFLYSLVSARLARSPVTAPMLFAAAGLVAGLAVPASLGGDGKDFDLLLIIAEIGLVLLLFTDASRTGLARLRAGAGLPLRLLGIGMPLTFLLGALAAFVVLPGLSVWEAGILAVILAPTDAGLGQVIVNSPRVPPRIRQALNVEAGLNDGLAVPVLLFFIAMVTTGGDDAAASLSGFLIEQLGFGVLVGAGIGFAGGWLLAQSRRRRWIADEWLQLGVVALPVLCLLGAERAGASMFIAAFVAGLAVQTSYPQAGKHSVEFTEEWGQLLSISVFFLFGVIVAADLSLIEWRPLLYALLSLTVIRMVPVALSLAGTRLSLSTSLFLGWFGPRGLASIVLGLVYLEQVTDRGASLPGNETIRSTIVCTVLLSIFAHGITAMPGTAAYARRLTRLPTGSPDLADDKG